MKIKYYSIGIKSDQGKFTAMTSATDAKTARNKVCKAYNAPLSAVFETVRVNKKSIGLA